MPYAAAYATFLLFVPFIAMFVGLFYEVPTSVGDAELVEDFEDKAAVFENDRIADILHEGAGAVDEDVLIHSNAQPLIDEAEDRITTIA